MAGTERDITGVGLHVLYVYDIDKQTYTLVGAGVPIKNIILY